MARKRTPRRRPGRKPRLDRLDLGLVAGALLVRLPGLPWGLPDPTHFFSWHPDEFEIAGRAIRILNTGDLHPEFFNYGSVMLYLTALLAWPAKALGLVGTVTGTHVVGRLVAIACGALAVPVVRRIARRAGLDRAGALLAAGFVALAPGLVLHSAWATVDVPATFFAALALLFALRALDGAALRPFVLAGAMAGLAAGTKYNVGLVLVAPLVAAGLAPAAGRRLRLVVASGGAALGAFLLSTPYALIDFAAFRRDLGYELFVHSREGHLDIFEGTGPGWTYHLLSNLPYALGVPLLLLALAGTGRMLARRRPADVVLLSFGLGYFALIGFSEVRFLRYVLPIVPVLAVAAAEAVATLRARSAPAAGVAAGVALTWCALLTAQQAAALLAPDPRRAAADWMMEHVPSGAIVALTHEPWFFTPPITPWNGGARSRSRFDADPAAPGGWRLGVIEDRDRGRLLSIAPEWVVRSEFEWREGERLRDPAAAAFRDALRHGWEPVARFEGLPRSRRWTFGGFAPHDWLYPFAEIRVWHRAEAEAAR
jgi:hypothetical protein